MSIRFWSPVNIRSWAVADRGRPTGCFRRPASSPGRSATGASTDAGAEGRAIAPEARDDAALARGDGVQRGEDQPDARQGQEPPRSRSANGLASRKPPPPPTKKRSRRGEGNHRARWLGPPDVGDGRLRRGSSPRGPPTAPHLGRRRLVAVATTRSPWSFCVGEQAASAGAPPQKNVHGHRV